MNKIKRKNKDTDTIPKPMKIKKEKTEEDRTLHSMAHYIDDRLELVKQIFGTLKPKTITNLSPDFLKTKSMEKIEEICLNELLCMSKKRLLSIINAAKCPTDTESSSDSDVEHKEEHISLEEISSDSEVDGGPKKVKKKKSKIATTTNGQTTSNENVGQISVLELLELQARARAIRSQLALEPITKIEVDSDDEQKIKKKEETNKSNEKTSMNNGTASKHNQRKRKPTERSEKASSSTSAPKSINNGISKASVNGNTKVNGPDQSTAANDKETSSTSKKIILKRNFRNANKSRNDSDTSATESSQNEKKLKPKEMAKDNKTRSSSPDVVTIVPEPVTLLISDSSEEDEMPRATLSTSTQCSVVIQGVKPKTQQQQLNSNDVIAEETRKKIPRIEEAEEGELSESDNEKTNDIKENCKETVESVDTRSAPSENVEILTESAMKTPDMAENDDTVESTNTVDESQTTEDETFVAEPNPEQVTTKNTSASQPIDMPPTTDSEEKSKDKSNILPDDNNDQDNDDDDDEDGCDDVISIEGGDLEMIEHLDETSNTQSSIGTSATTKNDSDNIIALETSDDERDKDSSESWQTRYMQSAKVSKVLTASRLAKRVRDKIKQTKQTDKEEKANQIKICAEAAAAAATLNAATAFKSVHEDGSMEQYKELIALRQRKRNVSDGSDQDK